MIPNGSLTKWAFNCDYDGPIIEEIIMKGEDCGPACTARNDCSGFTYRSSSPESGTCFLKSRGYPKYVYTRSSGACGVMIDREKSVMPPRSLLHKVVSTDYVPEWISVDHGRVQWAHNCDFHGKSFDEVRSRGDECGELCFRKSKCTRFKWTDGTCYFKDGKEKVDFDVTGGICGYVTAEKSLVVSVL